MKLINIEKIHEGRFLTYYIGNYLMNNEQIKKYEFVSRNKDLDKTGFKEIKAQAVSIIAFNEDETKILLVKEFRPACNSWCIGFSAGLIDEGENYIDALNRELFEETGLIVKDIKEVLPMAYSAFGISDESAITIICHVVGEPSIKESYEEEIIPKFYDKTEVKEMVKNGTIMSSKTQILLYMWSKE